MARRFLGVSVAGALLISLLASLQPVASAGPCDPTQEALTPERSELGRLVNEWRAAHLGQPAAELSGPANRAAQWFAEEALAGRTSGHLDQFGRSWTERLVDCGYDPYWAMGSGEAVAVFFANEGAGATAAEALARMTEGGAQHSNVVEAPVRWQCMGVGHAANPNANGTMRSHVWVVVMAQHGGPCPEPDGGAPPPPTPAPSPSPTVAPLPTPSIAPRAVVPALTRSE